MSLADLKEQVMAAAALERPPARNQARFASIVTCLAVLAAASAFLGLAGGVRPTNRPAWLLIDTAGGAGLIALAAVWIGLGRGGFMHGRSPAILLAACVATPLALVMWKIGVSSTYAGAMASWPGRVGFRCLGLSVLIGSVFVVTLVHLRQPDDARAPRLTGVALGAAAGAIAWTFVDLWCPVAAIHHILLGHLLPLAFLALAGWVAAACSGRARALP